MSIRKDRQEEFAKENYHGLEETGDIVLEKVETLKELWQEYIKTKSLDDEELSEEAYKRLHKYGESMEMDITIISLKLSNVVGHALNANSTKMIKKVINFMDIYGLNSSIIHNSLIKVASARNTSGDIITMAITVAAKYDDITFVKYVQDFVERNKDRENIYDIPGVPYSLKDAGNMSYLDRIQQKETLAFEALINNSPNIYKYITDGKGLKPEYIQRYINGEYYRRLSKKEVANVIRVVPDLIKDIIEHMPENVPEFIKEIFIF